MAFVKIRKGNDIKRIPKSVSQYYKRFGYRIIEDDSDPSMTNDDHERNNSVESIPLSEMTKDQLREFAEINGIDTSKARNIGEARNIIRRVLKERKM